MWQLQRNHVLEIALKVYERVIERRIRERVHIHSNQFGSMEGEPLIQFLFSAKYRKRPWRGIENDTGHLWIWRKLLTECPERCYTGV